MTLHVHALGTSIAVGSAESCVEAALARLWRPLLSPLPVPEGCAWFRLDPSEGSWTLRSRSAEEISSAHLSRLVTVLGTQVNALALSGCDDLAVHAGAVASGGRVVALAADSGVGKSTLTALCAQRGWEYVTDEALCLRSDGTVRSYAKPLALSAWSRSLLGLAATAGGEELRGVDDLGGHVAGGDLRLRETVLLERSPRPLASAELVPLHRAEALTGLLRLSFNHYRRPEQRVRLLAELAASGRAWRLRYSDARSAADLLRTSLL